MSVSTAMQGKGMRLRLYKIVGLMALLLFLFSIPYTAPSNFYIRLANEILIYGLLAMSLDLLLGYIGRVSFMHNAYLGIAAYITGIFLVYAAFESLWLAMLVGVVGTAAIATPVGFIQMRLGGLPFALLTIAFGMMFYYLVWQLDITGGSDGLMGVPDLDIVIANIKFGNTGNPAAMYLFTLLIVILCFIIMRRIVRSPFGAVLEAIRENEERASFIGINVLKFKLIGWVLCCSFAAVSGALFILYKGYVAPQTMSVFAGAGVLMMVLLGGIQSLWGAFIGATIFLFFEDYLSTVTVYWHFYVGALVILLVLFLPRGVAGLTSLMLVKKE